MTRRLFAGTAIGTLAAVAMVGGPITAASASDTTIKVTIIRALPGIRRDGLRLRSAAVRYVATHRAGPLVRAIRAEDRSLAKLRTSVRRSSASSATGARARTDIIDGLGLVLRSNGEFSSDLRRQANVGLSPIQIKQVFRLAERGERDLNRGFTLLAHS